jgi:hypothetical protein
MSKTKEPDLTVKNYSNIDLELNIKKLVSRLKRNKKNNVILKGCRKIGDSRMIIYIVATGDETKALERVFKNNCEIRVAKINNVKRSYFNFSTWDILRVNNGQISGSSMNMLNDNELYNCYKVVK